MDLRDVARLKWRRRWVTVPLLVLSAAAAAFAMQMTPPEYTGKAQIAVLPPAMPVSAMTAGESVNQFTAASLAEFLSISLSTLDIRRQIEREGLSADYLVTVKAQNLVLLGIEVEGKTAELVTKTIDRLTGMAQTEVVKLQGNPKPGWAFTLSVADKGDGVTVLRTAGEMALVVILGIGLIVTLAISLIADTLIRRRTSAAQEPETQERAIVTLRPAVGVAKAVPVMESERTADEFTTVSLDASSQDSAADNDVTIVLPLSGISRANAKRRQKDRASVKSANEVPAE